MIRKGRESEGESQADSVWSTEPYVGLDLMTLRSGPGLKPRDGPSTDCTSQASFHAILTNIFS